jgi:hypothetical protein
MSNSMTYVLASVLAVCVFGLPAVGTPQSTNKSMDATTLVALVAGDTPPTEASDDNSCSKSDPMPFHHIHDAGVLSHSVSAQAAPE